jgi:hypothetical protein
MGPRAGPDGCGKFYPHRAEPDEVLGGPQSQSERSARATAQTAVPTELSRIVTHSRGQTQSIVCNMSAGGT